MSKLLINESPLQVLPRLAVAIGLNEAIVLQQVHYWLERTKIEINGHPWVYNTVQQWREQFPFWSADTVRRTLVSLKGKRVLIGERLAENSFDKTMYYRIDYQELAIIEGGNLQSSEDGKLQSSTDAKASLHLYRTETTQETTQETKSAAALPEWLDPALWAEWVQHRKEIKKPMTPKAAEKCIEQLAAYRAQGIDPKRVIDHCIASRYQGLFAPRSDTVLASKRDTKSLDSMDYSKGFFD